MLLVLAVQAALSVRLVRADTAFQDEATSLWAGHLEWAHWLHGTPIPQFPNYFSGAPVIYPPLGALADSIGGLAAARLLSLLFMLGATALLWGTAGRLLGGGLRFSLPRCSLYWARRCIWGRLPLRRPPRGAGRAGRLVCSPGRGPGEGDRLDDRGRGGAGAGQRRGVLLGPVRSVLLALALLVAWPAGGRVAARRAATLLIPWCRAADRGVLIGGRNYLGGFERTTLARRPVDVPAVGAGPFRSWAGLIFVLAACAVIISWARRKGAARAWLLAVLAIAVVLGPLEQARLHTAPR